MRGSEDFTVGLRQHAAVILVIRHRPADHAESIHVMHRGARGGAVAVLRFGSSQGAKTCLRQTPPSRRVNQCKTKDWLFQSSARAPSIQLCHANGDRLTDPPTKLASRNRSHLDFEWLDAMAQQQTGPSQEIRRSSDASLAPAIGNIHQGSMQPHAGSHGEIPALRPSAAAMAARGRRQIGHVHGDAPQRNATGMGGDQAAGRFDRIAWQI